MRSRYAAFVEQNSDYLVNTWHASTRRAHIDFTPGQQWLLLRIIDAQADGDTATVEFVARSRIAGQTHVLHEVSRFVRDSDRWFYVDGEVR